MRAHGPNREVPNWARAVDVIVLVLLVTMIVVAVTGGYRTMLLGARFTVTSSVRILLWAATLAALRHWRVPRHPVLCRLFPRAPGKPDVSEDEGGRLCDRSRRLHGTRRLFERPGEARRRPGCIDGPALQVGRTGRQRVPTDSTITTPPMMPKPAAATSPARGAATLLPSSARHTSR